MRFVSTQPGYAKNSFITALSLRARSEFPKCLPQPLRGAVQNFCTIFWWIHQCDQIAPLRLGDPVPFKAILGTHSAFSEILRRRAAARLLKVLDQLVQSRLGSCGVICDGQDHLPFLRAPAVRRN